MDQSDLTLAQALLDCLDQPAFLLEDGVILSKNAQADEAEGALRELLRRELLRSGDVASCGGWTVTARPFQSGLLALARRLTASAAGAQTIREPLGALFSTVNAMVPALESAGNAALLRQAALLNQSLYRLLQAAGDLDLLSKSQPAGRFASFSLRTLLRDLGSDAAPLLALAGVTLDLELPVCAFPVLGDRQLLERGLLNLLANSARWAGSGAVLTLRLRRHRDFAAVELHCSQCGEEALRLLLTPGSSLTAEADTGLAVVRRIVQLHEGVFLLRPKDGSLTAFLAVPLSTDAPALLCSPRVEVDYTGGFRSPLLELSGILPPEAFPPLRQD